ncbi:MAG: hypothetical protein A2148_11635 [Chloroflexi bacterium RBG_16_68_14]|nr:MAG: hypothetical protein A2148_11635 [Chloroflexi bacterium RBG_16_68_14]
MYSDERRSRNYYQGRARWYDWANRAVALLRGVSGTRERRQAIEHLALRPGARVLEVSVGTGTNLPLISTALGGDVRLAGLDISPAMLDRCRWKLRSRKLEADLIEGEAAHLPFAGGAFDAVLHHGGLAEFGDRKGAIAEMVRVAKQGARVVICDVGVPTDRRLSLVNRLLLRLQPQYEQPPPLDLIPAGVADLNLSWFHGGAWYLIEFVVV